jgi:hypothetical protein
MSHSTDQLVEQIQTLTGAAPPSVLDADSPALSEKSPDAPLYLIGLIGGKEVGKSALVNALAGAKITEETSHGPGTQQAIAYVHHSQAAEVKNLLDHAIPGKYRLVPHHHEHLLRQVLLDLPDIDSRFAEHIQVTRAMLRHMLFPIWVQSIEKYADAQPQKLLAGVAAGNDPGNFLFCLNKADQLPDRAQADDLRADYARRLAAVLGLAEPPGVFIVSAQQPENFDFPRLSQLLSRQKTPQAVQDSRRLAGRTRTRSILAWIDRQNLPARAAALARLDEQASELLHERLGVPLIESTVAGILSDGAYRAVMTDAAFELRVARWPIVNVLHALLSPLLAVIRKNSAASYFGGAQSLVDAHLSNLRPLPESIQSTFAQLHQSNPTLSSLYEARKLWNDLESAAAAARLRAELIQTVERQRELITQNLSGRRGFLTPLFRFLLTIGALIWFPFVQPLVQASISHGTPLRNLADASVTLIKIFGAPWILMNAALLIVWYLALWALLRWDVRRRVDRLLKKWKTAQHPDPALNLATCTIDWIDDLLQPIRSAKSTIENLVTDAHALRTELN